MRIRQHFYVLSSCFSKHAPLRNILCMIGHPSFEFVRKLLQNLIAVPIIAQYR